MRNMGWLAGAVLLAACGVGIGDGPIDGTKTGNPGQNAKVQVQMAAYSSDENVATVPQPQALTTGVVVTRAIIGVEELEFVRPLPDGTCDTAILDDAYALEIHSFFAVDLVQGTALDELEIAKSDGFCAVNMSLEDGEELPAGTPLREFLDDARIYVEGTRADGTPFFVRSKEVRDLPLLLADLLQFQQDRETYTISFDVAQWFADVDLDGAEASGGRILIDRRNNEDVLAQFEASVAGSLGLCRDPDRDDDRYESCDGERGGGDDRGSDD